MMTTTTTTMRMMMMMMMIKVCAQSMWVKSAIAEYRHDRYCMEKGVQCIKSAVICISEDSESRNAGAQKQLIHVKEEQSDPFLSTVSPVPDAVHVAKRKGHSFSNWFLLANSYRINLVQLRELRNDSNIHSKLAPLLPLSAVRNRDREDVQ